ncbi:MAG: DUF3307 domain-containing protein [Bacteroidales bacterium]|nr:DUF3307 domain-containing protein [Bacteroidales bacterium]
MTFQQTLVIMLLAHLVSDYTLQGWLADGKQRSWWKKNVPDFEKSIYTKDYLVALFCHSLYWSIFICLPFLNSPYLAASVAANTLFHAYVDDLKANRHVINLFHDQTLHLMQIVVTAFVLFFT